MDRRAKHAAGRGLPLEQIKDELLKGRDLSKKGSRERQLKYAQRTARSNCSLPILKQQPVAGHCE